MNLTLGLRQLGALLVVWLWVVGGLSAINILHDWIREHFASSHKGAWVTRLAVMGYIRRVR